MCVWHLVLYPLTVNSSPMTNNGQTFSFTQKSCFRLNVHVARQALTCSTRGCPHHGWCGATECGRWPDLTWQLHPIHSTALSFLYGMQCCCCLDTVYRDRLLNYSSDISLLSIVVLHLRSLIGRLSHILLSISDQSKNRGEFRSQIFSPNTPNLLI